MEKAAQDLAIAGMWIAQDDGVLNPRTVKVGPRRIIVANSTDSMKPLLTGSDFQVAFTAEERLQASILQNRLTTVSNRRTAGDDRYRRMCVWR